MGDGLSAIGYRLSVFFQALARVEALDPERLGRSGITPLSLMDEAVVALMNAAWHAGVAVGDAFARAEMSLGGDRAVCPRCNGYGQHPKTDPLRPKGKDGACECFSCGGRGTVPADSVD